jgi:hypothetical protein
LLANLAPHCVDLNGRLGKIMANRVRKLLDLEARIAQHIDDAKRSVQPMQVSADPSLGRNQLSTATVSAKEAHQLIRSHTTRAKTTAIHIEEIDSESSKHGLRAELAKRVESCARLSSDLNDVSRVCRKREAELRRATRDALIQNPDERQRTKEGAGADQKKKNVTDSLRRSRQVLAQEVQRVASAGEEVKKGTSALEKLNEQQQEINMTAEQAKALLTAIEVNHARNVSVAYLVVTLCLVFQRRDRKDKLLIGMAFAFYISCVLYVISKRLKNAAWVFCFGVLVIIAGVVSMKGQVGEIFSRI